MFVKISGFLTLTLPLFFLQSPVSAKPLAGDICELKKAERIELQKQGVPELVAGGPGALGGNPGREQMNLVSRYLQLEADIQFRCTQLAQKKKSKFAVPLPVRNSRRVKQKKKASVEGRQVLTAHKLAATVAAATNEPKVLPGTANKARAKASKKPVLKTTGKTGKADFSAYKKRQKVKKVAARQAKTDANRNVDWRKNIFSPY